MNPGAHLARPFFFVHLMKTGGTSFAFHARKHFTPEQVYPCAGLDTVDSSIQAQVLAYASLAGLRSLAPARRAAIRLYTGHFPYAATQLVGEATAGGTAIPDPIVLTLVREPVARTISTLRHFQRLGPGSVSPGAPNRFEGSRLEAIYDDAAVHSTFIRDHQVRIYSSALTDASDAFGSPSLYRDISARLQGAAAPPDPLDETWTAAEPMRRRALVTALTNLRATEVVGIDDGYDRFVDELRFGYGWWSDGIDTRVRANASDAQDDVPESFRRRIEIDNSCDVEFYEAARDLVAARTPVARR